MRMKLEGLSPKFQKQALEKMSENGAPTPARMVLLTGDEKAAAKYGIEQPQKKKRPSKWGNEKVVDPRYGVFDSKGERSCFYALLSRYGKECVVIRQVSLPITENQIDKPPRMVLDFMVVRHGDDGTMRAMFIDFKGRVTPEWRTKQKTLESVHGIKVHEVKDVTDVHNLPDLA